MAITKEQLRAIMPASRQANIELYIQPINTAMAEFGIDSRLEIAAFLANCAHESGQMSSMKERASGKDYDTGRIAKILGNTPEADGDGQLYKGRGAIQITGRWNYEHCGKALKLDLLKNPELLEIPVNAWRASAWFWKLKGLNEKAQKGDFIGCCKAVNTALLGLEERQRFYNNALAVLK